MKRTGRRLHNRFISAFYEEVKGLDAFLQALQTGRDTVIMLFDIHNLKQQPKEVINEDIIFL